MNDNGLMLLSQKVGKLLLEKKMWLSCAESCTGGLLLSTLTDVAGSSAYVKGGVVCYTNEVKEKILGVSSKVLSDCPDAVCPQVAEELSLGVKNLLGTELGVGITGIAGPGGGSEEKPVGLVYIGVSGERGTGVKRFVFKGERCEIKSQAVRQALLMVKEILEAL